jgi:hypothetical protein
MNFSVLRLIQELGVIDELIPARSRMNVHLDHARVRRDLQHLETGIAWRRIPFYHHFHVQIGGGCFNGREQVEVVIELGQRRHEHMQQALAASE